MRTAMDQNGRRAGHMPAQHMTVHRGRPWADTMGPYLRRVKAALAASDAIDRERVSGDLEAELRKPNATIGSVVLILLILAVIHDMVFKPGV
jgi:hypothetical protein